MEVRRLGVEAFRSFYEASIEPGHFTVIVGANNAGKSNLAEAFEFLAEVHRHGLEIAVNRKGGFENIAHRRMRRTKRPLAFEVDVIFDAQEFPALRRRTVRQPDGTVARRQLLKGEIRMQHRFEIQAAGQAIRADFRVSSERLTISFTDRGGGPSLSASVGRDTKGELSFETSTGRPDAPLFNGFDEDMVSFVASDLEPTDLVTTSLRVLNPIVREFERRLANIHIYRLTPIECRKPGAPTPNPDLALHGENLPAVVAYMQRHHEEAWGHTLDAMRMIVPGLEDIRTSFTHDRRLTLQFIERGVGRPWTAEEISDGTVQSLALFAGVFDPRNPVSFIEEPENAVHPWIVRAFVDACRAVDYKQILVTTHSPALIGYLSPDEVMVIWRREGRSHLCALPHLDEEAMKLWSDGRVSTFELVDSGWLRQAVPEAYA